MNRIALRSPGPITLAWAIVVGYAAGVSSAQTREQLQSWLDERSTLGERIGDTFAVEATWSNNLRIPIDAATAEALSRDLSQYPDHPLRNRQQRVRDAATKGVDSERYLIAGNGRWRIAKDEPSSNTRWHSGGSGGDSWMWHDTDVTVINATRPPLNRDYPDLRFEYLTDILDFTTGGLSNFPPRTMQWSVVELTGSRWKAVAAVGDPPVTYTALGAWDATANQGVVHSITSDSSRIEFEDWRDRNGFWTAGVVKSSGSSGYQSTKVLKEIATPAKDRVAALARTPEPGKPDVLLAGASPTTRVDMRGTVTTAARAGPDGLHQLNVVQTPQAAARRQFRWAGWAIGGSLAVLLGVGVWWRVRSGSSVV